MRKYLLNILIFFVLVAAIDLGVGGLGDYLQSHAKGGMTKRTDDIAMKDCHDVVILGSSRAHHHYDTPYLSDTLGLDVYNAGYDGNGVVLAEGLLELILERYHPKLVVFDVEPAFDIKVYAADNNHIRYLSCLKPYYRHVAIGKIFQDVSMEEWYKVHSGLIRYNSNLITMMLDNFSARSIKSNGFAPLVGEYDYIPEPKGEVKDNIDGFKLEYIELLIKTAKQKNVPIIFVASPKLGACDSGVLIPVKQICERMGVPFCDYYADTEFQRPEYYKEPMHLNKNGARLFSTVIAQVIKESIN